MKPFQTALYIVFNLALLYELNTNEEHFQHADDDSWCWVFCTLCVSVFGVLAMLLHKRQRYFAELHADATPAPASPRRRDLPRPVPPPMVIREVPQERYIFIATNDQNVDLQPKERGRG